MLNGTDPHSYQHMEKDNTEWTTLNDSIRRLKRLVNAQTALEASLQLAVHTAQRFQHAACLAAMSRNRKNNLNGNTIEALCIIEVDAEERRT